MTNSVVAVLNVEVSMLFAVIVRMLFGVMAKVVEHVITSCGIDRGSSVRQEEESPCTLGDLAVTADPVCIVRRGLRQPTGQLTIPARGRPPVLASLGQCSG